eukprot:TRINITY_DN55960_c0_g1_i1.p1 TRINITY_DN55960_c0_g1~~TRINITY_DN55960_c0_g1_i1.p1  ORF type:complete len:857 (+),score=98.53 TRINITY_DN55960_c0_g1_i1:300-2573(+)
MPSATTHGGNAEPPASGQPRQQPRQQQGTLKLPHKQYPPQQHPRRQAPAGPTHHPPQQRLASQLDPRPEVQPRGGPAPAPISRRGSAPPSRSPSPQWRTGRARRSSAAAAPAPQPGPVPQQQATAALAAAHTGDSGDPPLPRLEVENAVAAAAQAAAVCARALSDGGGAQADRGTGRQLAAGGTPPQARPPAGQPPRACSRSPIPRLPEDLVSMGLLARSASPAPARSPPPPPTPAAPAPAPAPAAAAPPRELPGQPPARERVVEQLIEVGDCSAGEVRVVEVEVEKVVQVDRVVEVDCERVVESLVEVRPPAQVVVREMPVEQLVEVTRSPEPKAVELQKTAVEIERLVEVPVERTVEVERLVERTVEVERLVEVPVDRVSVVTERVEVAVEQLVELSREHVVERLVELPVYVQVPPPPPTQTVVERILPIPIPVERLVERLVEVAPQGQPEAERLRGALLRRLSLQLDEGPLRAAVASEEQSARCAALQQLLAAVAASAAPRDADGPSLWARPALTAAQPRPLRIGVPLSAAAPHTPAPPAPVLAHSAASRGLETPVPPRRTPAAVPTAQGECTSVRTAEAPITPPPRAAPPGMAAGHRVLEELLCSGPPGAPSCDHTAQAPTPGATPPRTAVWGWQGALGDGAQLWLCLGSGGAEPGAARGDGQPTQRRVRRWSGATSESCCHCATNGSGSCSLLPDTPPSLPPRCFVLGALSALRDGEVNARRTICLAEVAARTPLERQLCCLELAVLAAAPP